MKAWQGTNELEELWTNFGNMVFSEQWRRDHVSKYHVCASYDNEWSWSYIFCNWGLIVQWKRSVLWLKMNIHRGIGGHMSICTVYTIDMRSWDNNYMIMAAASTIYCGLHWVGDHCKQIRCSLLPESSLPWTWGVAAWQEGLIMNEIGSPCWGETINSSMLPETCSAEWSSVAAGCEAEWVGSKSTVGWNVCAWAGVVWWLHIADWDCRVVMLGHGVSSWWDVSRWCCLAGDVDWLWLSRADMDGHKICEGQ